LHDTTNVLPDSPVLCEADVEDGGMTQFNVRVSTAVGASPQQIQPSAVHKDATFLLVSRVSGRTLSSMEAVNRAAPFVVRATPTDAIIDLETVAANDRRRARARLPLLTSVIFGTTLTLTFCMRR
jgi:hypothetical protein